MTPHVISGFSRLSRSEKLTWLQKQATLSDKTIGLLVEHLHENPDLQGVYEEISENHVSNFILPLGLAPNFLINGKLLTIPMVIEESSVVAAASSAAKFWAMHGGFTAEVKNSIKNGQIHFTWSGAEQVLHELFNMHKEALLQAVKPLTQRMEQRGGGIEDVVLRSTGNSLPGSYQLFVTFQTANAMGANFINSVLEAMAIKLTDIMQGTNVEGAFEVIMSILSNYTPECLVTCFVEGETSIFEHFDPSMSGEQFARKFRQAVLVAKNDPYRAVTHNKGIFNGIDAVTLATGNDFRAVEASAHAYASKDGIYKSLSEVELSEESFRFSLEVPMAVGTVGGLTGVHPLAGAAMEILANPSAEELMQIIAAAGLANNFSAVRSLITSGIQQGHMKMHLGNILKQLKASPQETENALLYFRDRTVSYADVSNFIASQRDQNLQQ